MYKELRVLVLTTSYPIENLNDAGHFVESECLGLSKGKVNIQVLAPAHPKKSGVDVQKGIDIFRFNYFLPKNQQKVAYGSGIPENLKQNLLAKIQFPFFMLSFLLSARKMASNSNIIHCHWFLAGLIGAIIKGKNQKLVLMMHHPHKSNFIYKWILKKSDFVFSNSNYTKAQINAIYPVKNHDVIHLGIDMTLFKPLIIRNEDDIFKVLFVGRLIEWKGTEILLRAFNKFQKLTKAENIKLTIVGDGPLKKELEDLSIQLKCQKYVDFTGYITRNQVKNFYQNSSVFCIPSIELENGDTEGLGLTTIEACASEIPVIASRTGGIVDVVEDGKNGFLVNPGDIDDIAEKLNLLFQNKSLRIEMGKQGRNIVERKFSLSENAKTVLSAYNNFNFI